MTITHIWRSTNAFNIWKTFRNNLHNLSIDNKNCLKLVKNDMNASALNLHIDRIRKNNEYNARNHVQIGLWEMGHKSILQNTG